MKKAILLSTLALLAMVLLSACNSDDDMFTFDSKGEVVVKPISADEFNKCALGHGWKETGMYAVYGDGSYDKEEYYRKMKLGYVSYDKYEFSEGKAIVYMSNFMEPSTYYESSMRYDETTNKVYFNDIERFKVVSVSTDEIRLIRHITPYEDEAARTVIGYYTVLRRLTDEELLATREGHFVKESDMNRDMTWDDLIHKWMLSSYIKDGIGPKEVPYDRDNDNNSVSIQFFPDGSMNLKNYKEVFTGTFDYNGVDSIHLIHADGTPEWGGLFFHDFTSINKAVIRYGAYLELYIDNMNLYQFVRAKSD